MRFKDGINIVCSEENAILRRKRILTATTTTDFILRKKSLQEIY